MIRLVMISLLCVSCSWNSVTSDITVPLTVTGDRYAMITLDCDVLGHPPIFRQITEGQHILVIIQKTRTDSFIFYSQYPFEYNFEVPFRYNGIIKR
jgi:hypothetical protein